MGSKEDGSHSLTLLREEASRGPDGARTPVLDGMSEAELDAIVSMLRTDKNLTVAPALTTSGRWGALSERLLLSNPGALDPREARDEAARQAWFIGLDEKVVGPLEFSALRTYWERGELGPDSLCWRKGFEDWQPVCRVRGLAELLAPRATIDPSTPEDLVPNRRASALDFPLRGAEALRILATEDTPPPLPILAPSLPPPVLEHEPVTAPALEAEPDTVPDAPRAQDFAGAHEILAARPPTQVEVRVRGGAWLALGGGLVGGMLVSCAVWLLGLSAGSGVSLHARDTQGRASTASPAPVNPGLPPAAVASKPDATAAPVASKPDATAVPAASKPATAGLVPALGGGSGLGSAAVSQKMPPPAPTPIARSAPAGTDTVEVKRPAAVVRPALPDPSLRKPTKPELAAQPESSAPERVAARATEKEDEIDPDLALDAEFARELFDPAKRAKPVQRTVWIPPEPTPMQPPASLSESDVFSVVVANKADVASCVSGQKLASEEGSRKVVLRWTILPSGRVTDVETETTRLRGTPLALCLEDKIQAWTFPKHREQGGPVRFPFVF
ncbi:AgmX/PglI C-terminal domain-containing protein [Hyalangium versicolor]|uniref:AgmX/PglI C-terminal domain-containing protein n=1 Tax=Hyalangium versicolor TaxID=2861190 RepID=UPI001CCC96FD|nr:AgmX/PglI C-terminal domain-containing protein [Hyalangium versicolor]